MAVILSNLRAFPIEKFCSIEPKLTKKYAAKKNEVSFGTPSINVDVIVLCVCVFFFFFFSLYLYQ